MEFNGNTLPVIGIELHFAAPALILSTPIFYNPLKETP